MATATEAAAAQSGEAAATRRVWESAQAWVGLVTGAPQLSPGPLGSLSPQVPPSAKSRAWQTRMLSVLASQTESPTERQTRSPQA